MSGARRLESFRAARPDLANLFPKSRAAANQQSDATLQVNTSLSQISKLVQESSVAANHNASACTDRSNLALGLPGKPVQADLGAERPEPFRIRFSLREVVGSS